LSESLGEICRQAVQAALRAGAHEAEAWASLSRETEVYLENNDVKLGKSHRRGGIGIRVFRDRALGFASVNSFSMNQIEEAAERACAIATSGTGDPFNRLPDPRKVETLAGIYDPEAESFGAADALSRCLEMFQAAKSFDPRVSVDSGTFRSILEDHAVVNSRGVDVAERVSAFAWMLMGMALQGEEVSSFDIQVDGTHLKTRIQTAEAGVTLARNVVSSLGAKKPEGFTGPVILSPHAVQELVLGCISHAVDANHVQKGLSRLAGKLGQPVASPAVTLIDDGTYSDGLAAGSFDREGVPHSPVTVIEKGILRSYLYNTYTALKEDTVSTGHAAGDSRSSPGVGPSNLIMKEGDRKWTDLVAEVGRGLIVNRYSGGVNPVSGDFSGVVKGGHLVVDGEVRMPVRETLIAGNVYEMLGKVSGVSQERKMILSSLLPHLRVEDVSVTSS